MSLATRIIPSLLMNGRQLIKGVAFQGWRSVGLVEQATSIHSLRGVDELLMLDIAATREGRTPDLELIEELSSACFMPLSVGGGVRTVDDVENLLRNGADKVVIGTAAHEVPWLVNEAARIFGRQAIVVALDTKCGHWWIRNGAVDTLWDIGGAAELVCGLGAGEILLTNIELDGTLNGYDLFTLKKVASRVPIPVIAAGGCGTYQHMQAAVRAGASAVAAGSMFQWTDATPQGAAQYLNQQDIEVRL